MGAEAAVVVGDCRRVLPGFAEGTFDAVATDPPYEFGFMGAAWDRTGVAFDPATWAAVLRVLKPGGYMVAMGGTRTFHRLTVAVEDAGFEIRDCLAWLYGSGFPKGKGCLKPAWEPIILARKPGPKVLSLGVDECRVPTDGRPRRDKVWNDTNTGIYGSGRNTTLAVGDTTLGRYPANVVHDGSDEVLEVFAAFGPTSTTGKRSERSRDAAVEGTAWGTNNHKSREFANEPPGTAARFYYCAKASRRERGEGNAHPTVKPVGLMRWLVKLVCPPGGRVLDPFGGSGTTGVAAKLAGRAATLIEQDATHARTAARRMDATPWNEDAGEWHEPDFGEPAPPLWHWPDLQSYSGAR